MWCVLLTGVHSTIAYRELVEKIEQCQKFLCINMCFSFITFHFSPLPYGYVRYYVFNMGEDSFFLFMPIWYVFICTIKQLTMNRNWDKVGNIFFCIWGKKSLFDSKTPFGYFWTWLVQCSGATPISAVVTQFLNLVFGTGWLFIFIAEHVTQDVAAFNTIVANTKLSDKNCVELTKRFCAMVRIYLDAKQ